MYVSLGFSVLSSVVVFFTPRLCGAWYNLTAHQLMWWVWQVSNSVLSIRIKFYNLVKTCEEITPPLV